jgi:hypothetical protein
MLAMLGLMFDISCQRRQALQVRVATMVPLARTGLTAPAVAAKLERGLRRHAKTQRWLAYLIDNRQALLPAPPTFGTPMSWTTLSDSHLTTLI